jgi:site-specific recombinase XerD
MLEVPRAETAVPDPVEQDFWPAQSLDAWQRAPSDTFLTWLAGQRVGARQFRESSCETYSAMFATWLRHLESRKLTLLEATSDDATTFFEKHALEPVSRRRYLQLLDKVYRHLRHSGWAPANPLLPELKQERALDTQLPVGLDEPSQVALIRMLTEMDGWKGVRDRGMAALLLGAGLRTNELVALPVSALGEAFKVRVEPAGVHRAHTTLILPEGPWRGWVREWGIERIRRAIPGPLFCPATLKGNGYSPSGLFRRVSSWFELANVNAERNGAGILRNTFARKALMCGRYTTEEVQEFLGHEELRATARHMSEDSAT